MVRFLFVIALVTGASVSAQFGTTPEINPLASDSFWQYQLRAEKLDAATRTLAGNPTTPDAIGAYHVLGDNPGALRAAHRLVKASSSELAAGLRVITDSNLHWSADGGSLHDEVVALVDVLRPVVARLSTPDGGDAARWFVWIEQSVDRADEAAHQERIAAFRAKYAGTTAAAKFEVSLAGSRNDDGHDFDAPLRRYRELARRYDGTEAGAMALYSLGFRRGACCTGLGPDPTDRLLEVFDVVKQLEGGRFPASEWIERAPELVAEFYHGINTQIPAASVPRLYDAYLSFVLGHPNLRWRLSGDDAIGWIVRNGVSRLGSDAAARIAVVERFLDDLETRGFGVNATRFLRARFYLALTHPEMLSEQHRGLIDPEEALRRARESLHLMIESANATATAQAIATLAANELAAGRFTEARAMYRDLRERFPRQEWTWVAALRAAQTREAAGDGAAAADYAAVATEFGSNKHAVLLASLAAGELHEDLGDLPSAAAAYGAAARAWPAGGGPLGIQTQVDRQAMLLPAFRRYFNIKKDDVLTRVARLNTAVSPDQRLLYEGRRALEAKQYADAIAPLRRLVDTFPRSAAAALGRPLLRRARLARAITDIGANITQSEREFEALARGPYDSIVPLARMATGALRLRSDARAEAEAFTKTAFEEWHAKQSVSLPKTALEQDVAAIRSALFLPKGGGVFGTKRWNAFEWPKELPTPYMIAPLQITVKVGDGKDERLSIPFAPPKDTRVLFASDQDFAALRLILDRIGGTETREWVNALDVPNQPIGRAVEIAQMWAKFVPVLPGHWGGWEIGGYPYLSKITFDRDGHALAEFTIGYSGGTIELVKENGTWIAKRIVSIWIT